VKGTDNQLQGSASQTSSPQNVRGRRINLNTDLLSVLPKASTEPGSISKFGTQEPNSRISATLFDDAKFECVIDEAIQDSPDERSWTGHVEGYDGDFSLLDHQGVVRAHFRVPGKGYFEIRPEASGEYAVYQIDEGKLLPCGVGQVDRPKTPKIEHSLVKPTENLQALSQASPSGPRMFDDDPDILVLYTPATLQAMGGQKNVEALVLDCYWETNYAYHRSGVEAQIHLVNKGVLTQYPESGRMSTDLGRLEGNNDGFMDEAHTLRETLNPRADIVLLLVDNADYGGLANEMSQATFNHDFESYAFAVVEWRSAIGNMAFPHEISHIMGCGHDRDHEGPGMFDYSAGYHFIIDKPGVGQRDYRTIMAYRSSNGIEQGLTKYFSNPNVVDNLLNAPVGDAQSNNAATINQTYKVVAHFREH
jgi:hypothetical protein